MINAAIYLVMAGLVLVPVPEEFPEVHNDYHYEYSDEGYGYDVDQYKIDAGYDGNFIFY